jgi:putative acetyltransferase
MILDNFTIREIEQKDNTEIENVIRIVLKEFRAPTVGTACADKDLTCLYESYQISRAVYYVIEKDGQLFGGAGIQQLAHFEGNVCELQKMYFLPEARGIGLGRKLLNRCLDSAVAMGYDQCYLETLSQMKNAIKMYRKAGFRPLDAAMGNTGHFSCNTWMSKQLI